MQIRIPKHTGWGAHYEKFVRVAQQWSIVAVAATVRVEGGSIAEARVALTNMGSTPLRAGRWRQALVGQPATEDAVRAAAARAADGTNPPSDLNGDATTARTSRRSSPVVPCSPRPGADGRGPAPLFTVPADIDTAWATFMDLEGVAGCFPGAAITGVDGDTSRAPSRSSSGRSRCMYTGQGHFVERDDEAPPGRHQGHRQGQAGQRHGRGERHHRPRSDG